MAKKKAKKKVRKQSVRFKGKVADLKDISELAASNVDGRLVRGGDYLNDDMIDFVGRLIAQKYFTGEIRERVRVACETAKIKAPASTMFEVLMRRARLRLIAQAEPEMKESMSEAISFYKYLAIHGDKDIVRLKAQERLDLLTGCDPRSRTGGSESVEEIAQGIQQFLKGAIGSTVKK